ncbi:MAG: site-specific integrase, partial [Pirellulales bacterium]|nr:site-specific integrase [Pirellulales bacterium]
MYKRNESWYSDFRHKGERYVENHSCISEKEAEEKDFLMRISVKNGTFIKATDDPLGTDPTFRDAMKDYLNWSKENNQESTYERNLISASHLLEHFKSERIESLQNNIRLLESYRTKRQVEIREKQINNGRPEEYVSFSSINREWSLMRSVFNRLIKDPKRKNIYFNPVTTIRKERESERTDVFTNEQINKILETIDAKGKRYAHLKEIVLVALYTGARIGEILNMEKAWVNLDQGIITVPRHAQKVKKEPKRMPISFTIRPILAKRLKESEKCKYVFINPKTGDRFKSVKNAWNGVIKKAGLSEGRYAGVSRFRCHDLRHTAATRLAETGANM